MFRKLAWHVNDVLALLILLGVPALVVFAKVPEFALGAFVTGWTLVVQYFFRKAPPEQGGS